MNGSDDRYSARGAAGQPATIRRLVLAVAAVLVAGAAAAQTYLPLHLDSNDATSWAITKDINRLGDIAVGYAATNEGGWEQPVRWAGNGTDFLRLLPGDLTGRAYGVSDAGVIVGESDYAVQQGKLTFLYPHGVMWIVGQPQPVTLESLVTSGDTDIKPFAGLGINNHGQILGRGQREDVAAWRGFLLEDGEMTDLGSLQGTLMGSAEPEDLNEQGTVVGASRPGGSYYHAFVWQDGTMIDLHAASGVPGSSSRAQAINDAGLIVGYADPTADLFDLVSAAVWEDGVLSFLSVGAVGPASQSFAHDVNDHGTIVGSSLTTTLGARAVIWRDGQAIDLNALIPPGLGWVMRSADAISNDGRIVCEGYTSQDAKPFVLVPDSDGGFEVYGAGCAGGGGFTPGLWGQGWPQGGGEIDFALTNGPGGGTGLLLVGLDDQSAPFKGCTLSILPLSPLSLPLFLTAGGAGGGQWLASATLPPAVPAGSLYLQAALVDGGASSGVTLTNALRMDLAP